MAHERPVVFLAFANASDAHLDLLKTESREVFRALQPLEGSEKIAIHREESSAFDELYEDLLAYDQRIVIFHYGGHADGTILQFEGGSGGARGLARLLGQQSSLKLVFLNGCATKGHVTLLLKAGVPAVIATSIPIGDRKAQEFAAAFYAALAEGRSISEAFDSSSAYVQGKHRDFGVSFSRSMDDWEEDEDEEDTAVLEWGLYAGKDCAEVIDQWRLPDAQAEWQLQLTDSRGPLRNLDGSPRIIEHRSRTRTVDAILCQNCGMASSALNDDASNCPICNSDSIETGSAHTVIADRVLPFVITEDDARKRVLEYTDDDSKVIRINRAFAPYWIFDLETHTTFEAERGINRDFTAVPPKLAWERVKDEIDLTFDSYLVPASAAPAGRYSAAQDWYWELDQAEPLERIDTGTASIPLEKSMQSAFDQIASTHDRELDGEIADRVGGHQQRNVSTDTRYRNITANTVMLPHWYVTVEVEEGQAGLLVNGQTGAVRPLRLPGTVRLQNGSTTSMNKRTYEPGGKPTGTSLAASVFAGIGIGLMVGLLLGLANPPLGEGKPIVAIFIGAVGAALAALLGVNDRHFSTAKALRIGAFGLAVVIAAPIGIFVRDHELLAPDLPSLAGQKKELLSLGYKEPVALEMLRTRISKAGEDGSKTLVASTAGRGGLHSTPTSKGTCDYLADMQEWEEPDFESGEVIDGIKNLIDDGIESMNADESKWTPLLDAVHDDMTGKSQKNLLFIARDASCEAGNFAGHEIALADELCRTSGGANRQSGSNLVGALPTDDQKRVFDRITKDISLPQQKDALRLLGEFLCR